MEKEIVIQKRDFSIRISMLFPLVLPVVVILGYAEEFSAVFTCVCFHELAHMTACWLMKKKVIAVRLLPVGLNAVLDEYGCRSAERIIIYASGPALSLFFALVGLLLKSVLDIGSENVDFFIFSNIYIAFFNMMPILPLDGGKILKEIFEIYLGLFTAAKYLRRVSFSFSVLLFFLGLVQLVCFASGLSLMIAGAFIYFTLKIGKMEAALMNIRNIVNRRSRFLKKGVYAARDLVVIKSMRLGEVVKNMDFDRFHLVHVLDENLKLIKTYTEQDVIEGMLKYSSEASFEEFIEKCIVENKTII